MTTVLHLDDDQKMLLKASNALSISEFTSTFEHVPAATRDAFYERFNAQTPDCVLLDIIMETTTLQAFAFLKICATMATMAPSL